MDLPFTRYYWAGVHFVWIKFVLINPIDCSKSCIGLLLPFGLFSFLYQQLQEKRASTPLKHLNQLYNHPFLLSTKCFFRVGIRCADDGGKEGVKGCEVKMSPFREEDSEKFCPIKLKKKKKK